MAITQIHPLLALREARPLKGTERENPSLQETFAALLGKLGETSEPAPTDFPPLTAESAQEVATGVERAMNRHLLSTLLTAEQGDADPRYAGLFDRITLPGAASSKNPPGHQKDDAGAPAPEALQPLIDGAALQQGVDPALVRSVIKVESNFDSRSTSPKGAMGLMQLMPATARELGVANPYDPEENIRAGTRYLRRLLDRYQGDVPSALAAYNWGMGNLERRTGELPAETTQYVKRVLQHYRQGQV